MVILLVIVCSIIFLVVRAGDSAFGEFFGVLMIIALIGLIILGVIIFAGSFILPILAVLAVPFIGIWLTVKIVGSMFNEDRREH